MTTGIQRYEYWLIVVLCPYCNKETDALWLYAFSSEVMECECGEDVLVKKDVWAINR